jgi:O-antigen/teichoic acid export membrane protein
VTSRTPEGDVPGPERSGRSVGLRLFREGGLYTIGLFAMRAGNLLLLPVYLALLDQDEYGAFELVKSLVGVLVPLAICAQVHSVLRLGVDAENDELARQRLMSSVFTYVIFAAGVLTLAGILLWPMLDSWVKGLPLWPIGLAGLAIVLGQAVFQIALAWLQLDHRAKTHTVLSVARWGALLVSVLIFVPVFGMGAEGILLATAVSFALGAIVGLRLVMERRSLGIHWKTLRGSLAYGLPILPHAMAAVIFVATDRTLLARFATDGLDSVGVYSLAVNLASGVFMFAMGMQKAWIPFFLREDRDRESVGWGRVRVLSFFSVTAVACAAVGMGLLAPEVVAIVSLLTPNDYSGAAAVLPLLAFGAFSRSYYLVAMTVVLANKRAARWIALVTLPPAALTIGLNAWWIPHWGMAGAAAATTTSYLAAMVLTGLLSRRSRAVPFKYVRAALLMGLVGVVLALGYGADLPVRLGLIVAFFAALLVLDGDDIGGAIRSLRRQRSATDAPKPGGA